LVGVVGTLVVLRQRLHSQIDKIRSLREAEVIAAIPQREEEVMEEIQEIADLRDDVSTS
jgi:hypothetical protein